MVNVIVGLSKMIKRVAENLLPVMAILILAWPSVYINNQTAISSAQLKGHVADNTIAAQRNKLEKVGTRAVDNLPGCYMTLHFAGENEGWMTCLEHLWKTSDSGRTWQEIPYKSPDGMFPRFHFLNSKVIWAYTLTSIQKSENGGYIWKPISAPILKGQGHIFELQFLKDGRRGWLTGNQYVSCSQQERDRVGIHGLAPDLERCIKGVIFYTEDGGETWQQQVVNSKVGSSIDYFYLSPDGRIWALLQPDVFYLAMGEWRRVDYTRGQCKHSNLLETVGFNKKMSDWYAPSEIFFVGEIGWLAFSNGYLAKSMDGGRTWCDLFDLKSITNNPGIYFRKLYFSDTNNGWGLADHVYRTKDGGSTWERIETSIDVEDIVLSRRSSRLVNI